MKGFIFLLTFALAVFGVVTPVRAMPATGSATPTSHPTVGGAVKERAKEWFRRFQSGDIDRSQLNNEVNAELTPDLVHRESARLKPLGSPTSFEFINAEPIKGALGYNFVLTFKSAKVIESIAFDPAGKIAGIDFRLFLRTKR